MLEVSIKEGKIFKQLMPNHVVCSVHKRHYYITECRKAFNLLEKIRNGEDVLKKQKQKREKENKRRK